MTNETGLQFEKPDLLSQIDMSHDEVVRRARNEAFNELALRAEDLANRFGKSAWHNEEARKSLMFAYRDFAEEIRSRISEKGDGNET